MPCTLQPWEVEWEDQQLQKRTNKSRYGVETTDFALLTGLLCESCRLLEAESKLKGNLKKWYARHKKADEKRASES